MDAQATLKVFMFPVLHNYGKAERKEKEIGHFSPLQH